MLPWAHSMPVRFCRSGGIIALVLVTSNACRPRPTGGAHCPVNDQLVCGPQANAFVCDAGKWRELPCRGARGCARRGDADECDDTVAAPGDACPRNPPLDYACTNDKSKALVCKEGAFTL